MITGTQLRSARSLTRLSRRELADRAGVAQGTIARMESKDGFLVGRGRDIEKIAVALENSGAVFVPAYGGIGAGVTNSAGNGVRVKGYSPDSRNS